MRPFSSGCEQSFVVFRHGVLRKQFLVVGKANVGLARDGPEIQSALAFFLGFFRIGSEVRRMIGAQKKGVAHEHQVAFGGFDGVDDISFGFGSSIIRTVMSDPETR